MARRGSHYGQFAYRHGRAILYDGAACVKYYYAGVQVAFTALQCGRFVVPLAVANLCYVSCEDVT